MISWTISNSQVSETKKNERCCRGTSKIPASWLPKKKNWLRPLALPTQNLTLQDLGEHPTLPGVISSWFRPLAPVHGTNAQASDMLVEGLCQTWRRDCDFISCDDCDSLHNIGTYQNYVDTGKRPQTFG